MTRCAPCDTDGRGRALPPPPPTPTTDVATDDGWGTAPPPRHDVPPTPPSAPATDEPTEEAALRLPPPPAPTVPLVLRATMDCTNSTSGAQLPTDPAQVTTLVTPPMPLPLGLQMSAQRGGACGQTRAVVASTRGCPRQLHPRRLRGQTNKSRLDGAAQVWSRSRTLQDRRHQTGCAHVGARRRPGGSVDLTACHRYPRKGHPGSTIGPSGGSTDVHRWPRPQGCTLCGGAHATLRRRRRRPPRYESVEF